MGKIATGARHSMGLTPEATYGVTPATPAFEDIRHTSCTLALTKSTNESAELTPDRQIKYFRHGNSSVGGDVGIELSYGSLDTLLEAALCGTWDADVPSLGTDQLQVGTIRRSFSLERIFGNLATPEYHRFTGLEVNSFNLNVSPDAIVSGSFAFIAQNMNIDTAIVAGATYPAATTTEPFNSFSGVINEGGAQIGVVTSLDLTLENGLNPLFVVGSKLTIDPSVGKSRVTGTINAYFEDKTLLEKFLNETPSSITFTLVDPAGNGYDFTIPNIKYTGGQVDVSGEGEVSIPLPFQALFDVTEGSTLTIERTPI